MRHLWYWQGLRWAPGGLVLLATAATIAAPLPSGMCWTGWLLVVVGAARLHGIAAEYYGRRFPRLRPGNRTAGGLAASFCLIVAISADVRWEPPVLVTAVTSAAVLTGYQIATGGTRSHHTLGVGVLLGLGTMPAIGVGDTARARVLLWLTVGGVLYLVLAVCDHRQLVALGRNRIRRAYARRRDVRNVRAPRVQARRGHAQPAFHFGLRPGLKARLQSRLRAHLQSRLEARNQSRLEARNQARIGSRLQGRVQSRSPVRRR